jgi:hypothetical protein
MEKSSSNSHQAAIRNRFRGADWNARELSTPELVNVQGCAAVHSLSTDWRTDRSIPPEMQEP